MQTELPDMGTWESGTLNAETRRFDLLCTGKCNLTTSSLKLNVESSDKIPNFFTKNSEGKIVFSTTSPMSVITTPKGHGTWIQIELKTINGVNVDNLSGIAKHICLGIKKRSENDYFDVIHAGKLTSEYVDLFDTDAVELIPLLSKTDVTSDSYELVKPGDEITPSDFGLTGTSFDFGSVYRVNIKDHGAWIEKECNLATIESSNHWFNIGRIGIGTSIENEECWLAISTNRKLARSINALSWLYIGSVDNDNYDVSPTYGNGVWCINSYTTRNMKYSVDGGKTWLSVNGIGCYCLAFGSNVFMAVDYQYFLANEKPYSKVYTSPNAKIWTEIGTIPRDSTENPHCILIYGNNKWICGTREGTIYQSKDGKEWRWIGEVDKVTKASWYGGCYTNGYFYILNNSPSYAVMRSPTGEKWEEIAKLAKSSFNITHYKGKLYSIDRAGSNCYIGIPNS